ncbi:MAG: FkbM family methyltransferase, partial [Bacteroidia bacterium]|nr:FkbM family methyltransferase [Bacteroidia bacterium]
MDKGKSFIRKISNFKVLIGYILESLNVIKQGYTIRDKIILILYFLKTPIFLVKSLLTGKLLREIEAEDKFLVGDVILKNKYGKYYCGNNILTVYIADENYEKHLFPYLELKDGLFIDVGAHIGKYTIKLGKTGSNKVIAIEPEKNNYNFLEKNVQLNSLDNVT